MVPTKKHIYPPHIHANPAPVYPRLSGHMIPQAEQQKYYDISSHIMASFPSLENLRTFFPHQIPFVKTKGSSLQPLVSGTAVAMSRS